MIHDRVSSNTIYPTSWNQLYNGVILIFDVSVMHCSYSPPGGDSRVPRSSGSAGARTCTDMDNNCGSGGRPVAAYPYHTCTVETWLL